MTPGEKQRGRAWNYCEEKTKGGWPEYRGELIDLLVEFAEREITKALLETKAVTLLTPAPQPWEVELQRLIHEAYELGVSHGRKISKLELG